MEDQSAALQPRRLQIVFPDEPHTPVLYVNAMHILIGPSEFFVTLGAAPPPQLRTQEDYERIDHLTAEPYFRFAVPHQVFKDFIDLMTSQYDLIVRQRDVAARAGADKQEGEQGE